MSRRSKSPTPFTRNTKTNDSKIEVKYASSSQKDRELHLRDYSELIQGNSIENFLLTSDYTPVKKVIIEDEKKNKIIRYIKVYNILGQYLYVEIDIEGFAVLEEDKATRVEVEGDGFISDSFKIGALKSLGLEVAGVAFECSDETLVVSKLKIQDDEMRVSSVNYSTTNNKEKKNFVAYPMIRLSEIVNPKQRDLLLEVVGNGTRHLRNQTFEKSSYEFDRMTEALDTLVANFNDLLELRNNYGAILSSSIRAYEMKLKEYLKNPPVSDEERLKFQKLQAELRLRNEKVHDLLSASDRVSDRRDVLKNLAQELVEVNKYWKDNMKELE